MWELENVSVLFQELNIIAKECGYFISLNGSVLFKGYSEHDLDIIACKYIETPDEKQFIKNVVKFLDGYLLEDVYEGMFTNAYLIEITQHYQSHLIDISIRK